MPTVPREERGTRVPQSLAQNTHGGWLSRHGEACLFWVVVAAHLVPIWAFRYLPTQDGPVHMASSIIFKEHGSPGTRHHEFFDLHLAPFPNWTSHLVLAGLMFLVPPLLAEKLLVSVYVVGFAGGLRYLCGSFGDRTRPLALVGLLFVFNRCYWLGFYNFILSLALCWFTLGYWVRRREHADITTAACLAVLLVVLFFTHLVGFVVTATGLGWLALTSSRGRWRALGWLSVAAVPALLLTVDYFDRTGFVGSGGAKRLHDQPWQWLTGQGSWKRLTQDLIALDRETFAHHVQDAVPMTLIALELYAILLILTIVSGLRAGRQGRNSPLPARWPMVLLALGFGVLYVTVPDDLQDQGSFLKCRLALLPPLLLLTCFREPALTSARLIVRSVVVLVLGINLVLATRRVADDNAELAEYTAGLEAAGSGRTLFVIQEFYRQSTRPRRAIVDPLLHASQYYTLGTGTLNLDNYEAGTKYFPLRYRAGVPRGRGIFTLYARRDAVDLILTWEVSPDPVVPPEFRPVFRQGRLVIFAK